MPRIHLAIDNCFASKRWTKPSEWANVISRLGLHYIEASADNECDPLYMGEDYLQDWAKAVNEACDACDVSIANLYSGHGTYATLGLAHTDARIRDRFLNQWLKPMALLAKSIGGGFGFFCHAFSDSVLQNPNEYATYHEYLMQALSDLAIFSQNHCTGKIGLEQMYTPHQYPWTIEGARTMLRSIYTRSLADFYLTIDVGHQSGQRRFLRPSSDEMMAWHDRYRAGEVVPELWLGPKEAFELFECYKAPPIDEINALMDRYPYMFAAYDDGDPYTWLRELGCYSPIIHLQQTDGKKSCHWPFTQAYNEVGIIEPRKVLEALNDAYASPVDRTMPERCTDIFLTLEMFTGTAEINRFVLMRLEETITYWREQIPRDGMELNDLVATMRAQT